MKIFIKFQLISICLVAASINIYSGDLKKKYLACKASCSLDEDENESINCPECVSECQNNYCRAKCYRSNSDFKKSSECLEYKDCVLEKHRYNKKLSCDPGMCLDQAKLQKICMKECNTIFDMAAGIDNALKELQICSECYCFRKDNREMLGKAVCNGPSCMSCDSRCKNAYKKYEKSGIAGACSNITNNDAN